MIEHEDEGRGRLSNKKARGEECPQAFAPVNYPEKLIVNAPSGESGGSAVAEEAFLERFEVKTALRGNVDGFVIFLFLLGLFAEEIHLARARYLFEVMPDFKRGRSVFELRIEERNKRNGTAMLGNPDIEP